MLKSIRAKLLCSHLAVALIGMTLIGGVAYHMGGNYLMQAERQKMYFIVHHMGEMILQAQNYRKEVLARISHTPEVENFSKNFRILALSETLMTYKKIFPNLSYLNEDGFEDVRISNGKVNEDLRDFSQEYFFLKSKEEPGRVFYLTKSADNNKILNIIYYYGLKNYFGDEFTGTLMASFPVSDFSSVLKMFHVNNMNYAALIDTDGKVLISSKTIDMEEPLSIPGGVALEVINRIRAGKSGEWRGNSGGEDYLIVYAPVKGQDFSVVAAVNYEFLLGGPKKMRKAFLVIFVLICSLVAAAVYKLTANMTRPIIKISEAAESVASGNPTLININYGEDEIGQLLTSFNMMVKDLKKTTVSKNYMDGIVHSMGDSLMVIRSNDTVETVNLATCQMLEYKRSDDVIGKKFASVIGVEPPEGLSWFGYLSQVSGAERVEMSYRTKNGRNIPVLFSSSLLKGKMGEIIGVVCVAHDISAIKKSEEKVQLYMQRLRDSNAELEEFAYVASHDLQEPLRKITGFGERLVYKFSDQLGEQGRDYLARMDSAARRMQVLIEDLLAYSRVKSKANPFVKVDLSQIFHEVLEDLELRIKETNARVNVGALETIDADPLQMRQLFQNMIGNALKFCRQGVDPEVAVSGRLLPSPEDDGNVYEITISDNGIGFDEKYAERIFTVFQRLHGRTSYEGSGVGLSICKKIVMRHGGNIVAQSTPGAGAKFIITLSVKQSVEEER